MSNSPPLWQSVEWLTRALQSTQTIGKNTRVIDVTSKVLTGGFMAETMVLHLKYDHANGREPTSLVAKFPSENPDSRASGQEMGSYAKEINFYKEVSQKLPLRTPKCYYADFDQATSEFALLLEDLSPAMMASETTENTKGLVKASLSELALLHGEAWGKSEYRNFADRWSVPDKKLIEIAKTGWSVLRYAMEAVLPNHYLEMGDSLAGNLRRLYSYKNLRPTLIHGDYRFANILYKSDNSSIALDWQTFHWNNPGYDLAHMLICSLTAQQVLADLDEYLEHYHSELLKTGVTNYSLEDCYFDFRLGVLFDMHVMMITTFGIAGSGLDETTRPFLLNGTSKAWQLSIAVNAMEILNEEHSACH